MNIPRLQLPEPADDTGDVITARCSSFKVTGADKGGLTLNLIRAVTASAYKYINRNMKKVLLNAYACSPIRGSEPNIGWSWATNIAKQGYEVWCLTNIEDRDVTIEEHKKMNLPNLHFIFVDLPYGMDKHFLDASSKKVYIHYLLWKRKASSIAQKLHKDIRFDIAHHVTYGSLQQGTYLWKLKGVKFIFGPVSGGQKALPEFKEYFESSWKIEVIRNLISGLSIRFSANLKNSVVKADWILAANNETKLMIEEIEQTQLGSIPANVAVVLDNAVPATMQKMQFKERVPGEKLQLLWVGRMLPRKGLKLILHALSYLPEDAPYHLTIVGGGEQFPMVEGWIREYNLDPARINIVGQIPFSQVIQYYQQSDVFIFCSLRDACGAQLNEAMAFGLPVITFDTNGASLAVPDNCGIKIKPTTKEATAEEMAKAILKFCNDIPYRQACSKHAFNHAGTNTWEKKISTVTSKYYN